MFRNSVFFFSTLWLSVCWPKCEVLLILKGTRTGVSAAAGGGGNELKGIQSQEQP